MPPNVLAYLPVGKHLVLPLSRPNLRPLRDETRQVRSRDRPPFASAGSQDLDHDKNVISKHQPCTMLNTSPKQSWCF